MYPVSDAFLAAVKQPVVEYSVSGMIGSVSFGEANIVSGSFKISNQCTDSSDVVLGSVYVGQLESTFVDVNIDYTDWIGKVITPILSLKVGPTSYEGIALGTFTVAEAVHTSDGVQVVAYDNMCKFDRKFKKANFRHTMTPIQIAQQICSDCGVTFGNTVEECQAFVNYDETIDIFGIYGKYKDFNNDIDTYRDLLFWCAQTLGAFATINRDGELVLKAYSNDVIDTISESHRLSGAQFEDYITNYTGIYVADMRWGTESYYGYDATALTAEIALVDGEIDQVDSDLVQLEIDYAEGHITEEEYKTQKSALTKQRKQLQKRLNWLNKALAKAQAGTDGSYMDLGENPFLQDKTYSKRERERRAVLSSLDMISYTPFSCDTVVGAHYDLGDVIYFTGGHAGTDGVFACIMSYEFVLNGAYFMEGFGVNPAVENTKNKAQKTASMANANAMAAKEISNGTDDPPADAKDGDVYIKRGIEKIAKLPVTYVEDEYWVSGGYTMTPESFKVRSLEYDKTTGMYKITANGYVHAPSPGSNLYTGAPILKISGVTSAGQYKIHFKTKYTAEYDGGWGGLNSLGLSFQWDKAHTPAATSVDNITRGNDGVACNIAMAQDTEKEYELEFTVTQQWVDDSEDGLFYLVLPCTRILQSWSSWYYCNFEISEFYLWYLEDAEWYDKDEYIKDIYAYIEEKDESGSGTGVGSWKKIDYIAGADTSSHSGLSLDYKKILSLTPEVMRAWFKADPPQAKQTFNRYCVRYTGKPDKSIDISLQSNTGWLNDSIKKDSEGVFTLKSGGTVSSGAIEYCAYKMTGLTVGQKYFFNFKINFKDGTTFGDDYTKGLGLVFNTTGIIDTDSWTGDPNTFDENTMYYSMNRRTSAYFADFSFTATANTMYMCVVVADIADGETSSLTMSKMVISKTEREYIRNFYLFDTVSNDWLQYKPWGSGDDSGGGDSNCFSDLDDVHFNNLQNGQVPVYNAEKGEWENGEAGVGDYPDLTNKPSVNSVTLVGNKTSRDLGIMQELTLAQYNALPTAEKNNPDKIYLITDAGMSGGAGSSTFAGLSDVNVSNPQNGQVPVFNSQTQKWENGNQSGGGTTVEANPSEVATATLTKIKIGNVVYDLPQGGGTQTEAVISFVTPGYSDQISGEYVDYEIS